MEIKTLQLRIRNINANLKMLEKTNDTYYLKAIRRNLYICIKEIQKIT